MKRSRLIGHRGFSLLELIVVVGLIGVVSAIAVPMFGNMLANFRLSGDARGAANAVALAKMRASSIFTKVRVHVGVTSNAYYLETWDPTALPAPGKWVAEGGTTALSQNVLFGYGVVGAAPAFTQGPIGQAPPCKNDAATSDISGSACVIFNSRGVPVDTTGAPTAVDAMYITDGNAVYGITISATGMIRTWRTLPLATPAWVQQ
ncbi:MAG TPA: prepilin-type N-terminal cleavage/methylation domain-containing protein [Vicinamibacterales bacterium]|jgi:prepilin-type N-terminal cleavage/methylation domain-containing protein